MVEYVIYLYYDIIIPYHPPIVKEKTKMPIDVKNINSDGGKLVSLLKKFCFDNPYAIVREDNGIISMSLIYDDMNDIFNRNGIPDIMITGFKFAGHILDLCDKKIIPVGSSGDISELVNQLYRRGDIPMYSYTQLQFYFPVTFIMTIVPTRYMTDEYIVLDSRCLEWTEQNELPIVNRFGFRI